MDELTGLPSGWVVVSDAPPQQSSEEPISTKGLALPMLAAGKAVPATANLAVEAATNPGVPKAMSTVGQIVGGIEGLRHEGPLGAAAGTWTGGKAGYFTGKLLQRMGAPVASAMDRLAPYAQTLSTVGGAAGVGDLAQMAEPNRKDIGFLGIGRSVPSPEPASPAHFGGAGTVSWSDELQQIRDAIWQRLAGDQTRAGR